MQLTPHFSFEEMTHSATAEEQGLNNIPGLPEAECLLDTCEKVMEPIRELFGRPVHVNVAYRSPEVNKLVGGVPDSQHVLGQAVDFTIRGVENDEIVRRVVASDIPYDQLIWEQRKNNDGTTSRWIHVSYGPRHRREALRKSEKGYEVYKP